jgi:sec-independent protein translocase protein TatA
VRYLAYLYITVESEEKERKMIGGLGLPELLIILVIIMVIFGAGKLPEIGAGLGQGIKNFKKAMRETKEIDVTPAAEEQKNTEKQES